MNEHFSTDDYLWLRNEAACARERGEPHVAFALNSLALVIAQRVQNEPDELTFLIDEERCRESLRNWQDWN